MKRAFLSIAWGINPDNTTITGPYDQASDAREILIEAVRESDDLEKGAVLGPIPIEYLDDEPEVPRDLQARTPEEFDAKLDGLIRFAVNDGGLDLKETLWRIEQAAADWSENLSPA